MNYEKLCEYLNKNYRENQEYIIYGTEWDVLVDVNFLSDFRTNSLEQINIIAIADVQISVYEIGDELDDAEEVDFYQTDLCICIKDDKVHVTYKQWPFDQDYKIPAEEFQSKKNENNIWELNGISVEELVKRIEN